ncbi:MAG: hypothetical protein ABIK98_12775 [Pseudomonadota bacterium]
MRRHSQNVERIIAVARQLEELLQNVVFAGGAVTGLLITDPAFSDVRPTIDIDVIVEDILISDEKIKSYLADHCKQLLENDEFLDALPAHLPPDQASQQRVSIIEDRMRLIAEMPRIIVA